MTKVEAFIRPNKFDSVQTALAKLGVDGLTVSEVRGYGRQKGHVTPPPSHVEDVYLRPKVRLELMLRDECVDAVLNAIVDAAFTGNAGDGKIFLYKLDNAVRIRDRARGEQAL